MNFKTNMTKRKILKDYNDDKLLNSVIKKELANKYVIPKPFNYDNTMGINLPEILMKKTLIKKTIATKTNATRNFLKGLV